MHTSSGVDNIDEVALTVEKKGGKYHYLHGTNWRPLAEKSMTVPYRAADGSMKSRSFTTWRSHHGPVIRAENGKWIAVALMHRPVAALEQLPNRLTLCGVKELGQLGEVRLDALVRSGDGGHVRALERGAADLIEAVAHWDGVYSPQVAASTAPIRPIASSRRSSGSVRAIRTKPSPALP
jgi:hypothetical protein